MNYFIESLLYTFFNPIKVIFTHLYDNRTMLCKEERLFLYINCRFTKRFHLPIPMINIICSTSRCFASMDISSEKDYYKTLGIERDATAKEIKAAFYELSKKHHPDMNPVNKDEAAKKFQDLSEAYEVLSSDEKKQIYDSLTAERPAHPSRRSHHTMGKRAKNWTDLDLDYSDFEHFQKLNRRKRVFHGHAGNTTEAFWAAQQEASKNYRNQRALEREMLERQLHAEMEERERRAAHPIPTFEQLLRLEEERMRREKLEKNKLILGVLPFLCVVIFFVIVGSGR